MILQHILAEQESNYDVACSTTWEHESRNHRIVQKWTQTACLVYQYRRRQCRAIAENYFRFSNDEFAALLCYCYFIRQPSFIPGSRSNCKRSPLLGERGHQVITSCGNGAYKRATHDGVPFCIKDWFNSCGIKTRLEEHICFREADEDNNFRPDIFIFNLPGTDMKVVADVQNIFPIPDAMGEIFVFCLKTLSRTEYQW